MRWLKWMIVARTNEVYMITEIAQIKRFLADRYALATENYSNDWGIRIIDPVPDCDHMIPLGGGLKPTRVVVKDDKIHIDPLPGTL